MAKGETWVYTINMYLVRSVDPGTGVYPSIRFPAMVSPVAAAIAGIVKLAADRRLDLREARLPTLGTPFCCWGVEILLKTKDKESLNRGWQPCWKVPVTFSIFQKWILKLLLF